MGICRSQDWRFRVAGAVIAGSSRRVVAERFAVCVSFIAGLRHNELTAPWIIPGEMDREAFNIYIETQLAPTLAPGEVVIPDNLLVHKRAMAEAAVRARGAGCCYCANTLQI